MFGYGFLSVVLVLYLEQVGLSQVQIGLLLTLTLIGDTIISLWITTNADRIGRRRMLIVGALLMVFAGVLFAVTRNFLFLLIAATIGVISPSGYEVGPFLSIEQAALSQIVPNERRTHIFAWYNLVGSFATALGALGGGGARSSPSGLRGDATRKLPHDCDWLCNHRTHPRSFIHPPFSCSRNPGRQLIPSHSTSAFKTRFGLHRSRGVVLKLSALFSIDAFAGGFVLQSILAYWFHVRFNVQPAILGSIFFGANILAGLSALSAAWVASKIGLIRTMVFTHIPSNILLILVPLMPNLAFGHCCPVAAFQHFTDGCANPPILHHGCRGSG